MERIKIQWRRHKKYADNKEVCIQNKNGSIVWDHFHMKDKLCKIAEYHCLLNWTNTFTLPSGHTHTCKMILGKCTLLLPAKII